jgi:hypothetical protein
VVRLSGVFFLRDRTPSRPASKSRSSWDDAPNLQRVGHSLQRQAHAGDHPDAAAGMQRTGRGLVEHIPRAIAKADDESITGRDLRVLAPGRPASMSSTLSASVATPPYSPPSWLLPVIRKRSELSRALPFRRRPVVLAMSALLPALRDCRNGIPRPVVGLPLLHAPPLSLAGAGAADRLERRADQLHARAGVEDDAGLIHKHKWMRWRTFNRLMDQANDLAGAADASFALRIMRLFGKTPDDLYKDLT